MTAAMNPTSWVWFQRSSCTQLQVTTRYSKVQPGTVSHSSGRLLALWSQPVAVATVGAQPCWIHNSSLTLSSSFDVLSIPSPLPLTFYALLHPLLIFDRYPLLNYPPPLLIPPPGPALPLIAPHTGPPRCPHPPLHPPLCCCHPCGWFRVAMKMKREEEEEDAWYNPYIHKYTRAHVTTLAVCCNLLEQ